MSGDGGGCVVVWRVVDVDCNAAGCVHAIHDDSLGVVIVFAKLMNDSGSDVWFRNLFVRIGGGLVLLQSPFWLLRSAGEIDA